MPYVIVRHSDYHYFTGEGALNARAALGTWSPFLQFAKVYTKRAWAQKAARKLEGTVVVLDEVPLTSRPVKQQPHRE